MEKNIDLVNERCAVYGANALFDYEIISVIAGINAEKAKEIVDNAGGLQGLASYQLKGFKGITKAKAARIKAAIELGQRMARVTNEDKTMVKCPGDVADIVMEEMRNLDREHFRVVHLNTKHHVIDIETISVGSLNSSLVHPREVFKNAIKRSSAALILVHNHPSGDTAPSNEDIDITKRLVEAGTLIGIEVLDHVVIGKGNFCSLREAGMI